MRITLEHRDPDDRGIHRIFSISSAPFERHIRITTKFDLENGSSLKRALRDLKEGAAIRSDVPRGKMFVDGSEKSLCLIAGGIGITPFRSILLDLAHQRSNLPIVLLYSNRTKEVLFKDEIEDACSRMKDCKSAYVFSPERITSRTIADHVGFFDTAAVLISGSPGLVKSLTEQCIQMGKPSQEIKRDLFVGY